MYTPDEIKIIDEYLSKCITEISDMQSNLDIGNIKCYKKVDRKKQIFSLEITNTLFRFPIDMLESLGFTTDNNHIITLNNIKWTFFLTKDKLAELLRPFRLKELMN